MLKKYLPYIALAAAALLLLYIKKNQRGPAPVKPDTEQTERITVTPVLPDDPGQKQYEGLDRNASKLIFSKHAKCRMDCRHIDESEVREILKNGTVNENKIQRDKRGITWPVEGTTHDGQRVRIVFAPKDDGLVVVTVIDLGTEWSCDCN